MVNSVENPIFRGHFLNDCPESRKEGLEMLSQALFSVLLIAGCLLIFEVGIRERPLKRFRPPG
jgi:hypothetical protein